METKTGYANQQSLFMRMCVGAYLFE